MSARRFVSRVTIVVGAVMMFWCASALASVTHPYVSSFGSFTNVQGVAVDQSTGDVYVLDTGSGGSLSKFDAAGDPAKFTGLPGEPSTITGIHGGGEAENEIAVDNSTGPAKGDIYVAVSTSNGENVDIIGSDGTLLGTLSEAGAPWGETCGVAVDPSGNVYVGLYGAVDEFSPKANPVTNADYVSSIGGAGTACNLAVDSAGNVFAAGFPEGPVTRYDATQFGSLSATGSLVGASGSTLAVDPADDHVFVDERGAIAEFGAHGEPFEEPVGTFGQSGQGAISGSYGIAVDGASDDVYASNGKGQINIYGPAVPVPTVISGQPAEIAVHSVTLNGSVDPEGSAITECKFEYGTSTGYGLSAPCSTSPGSGATPVAETATVTGLQLGTTYYFRLVASDATGEHFGVGRTFTTTTPDDSTGTSGLPDGRVYELVTPPEGFDSEVYQPIDPEFNSEYSNTASDLPFQSSAEGDKVAYVGGPTVGGSESSGYHAGNEYLATRAAGGGWTQTNITPDGVPSAAFEAFSSDLSVGFLDATEPLSSTALGFYDRLYSTSTAGGEYQPLFMTNPPYRPEGSFGTYVASKGGSGFVAGEIDAPGLGGGTTGNRAGKFLTFAGASADLTHVLFLANDALTGASEGRPGAEGGASSNYEEENNLYESVDGQLRLVNVLPNGTTRANGTFGGETPFRHVISADGSRIFWTDLTTGRIYLRENGVSTVEISPAGKFQTATSDGSIAYFTNGDLYAYEVGDAHSSDLTPGVPVQRVVGTSENGEYIYYVTTSGEFMLWHNGVTTAIAPSSASRAEVTPDGHSAVFAGASHEASGIISVYDADTGRTYCASCGSGGDDGRLPMTNHENVYQPRWISADGSRVFFDSEQALVPQDTDGKADAYEWERPGAGGCERSEGCIYLLTGGTSTDESYFVDASESGDDVFLVTRAKLVASDDNELFDLYDARVDGYTAPAPPACTGSGCQGLPGAPPIFATPSSVTFEGLGNFTAPAPKAAKTKPKAKKKHNKKPKKKHKKSRKKSKASKSTRARERSGKRGGRS